MKCLYCEGKGEVECQGVADNMDFYIAPCQHCNGTGEVTNSEKEEKKVKNIKKFYVGSRATILSEGSYRTSEWGKDTLDEAIEHATELCQETDKEQYVVQVVKVVRPKRKPVEVTDVE